MQGTNDLNFLSGRAVSQANRLVFHIVSDDCYQCYIISGFILLILSLAVFDAVQGKTTNGHIHKDVL